MKARHLIVVLTLALLLPLGVAAGLVLTVVVTRPLLQGERIEGPHGVVGVWSGESYVWVVPAGEGVVLVDAGSDPEAPAVVAEVAGRRVEGVLLTHGHVDHLLGLQAFPGVRVVHGPQAGPVVRGEALPGSFLGDLAARQVPWPPLPSLEEVADGDSVMLGGQPFVAVHVPGHSPGATAWQWRDVVFAGDTVMATSPPRLPPDLFTTDPVQARASVGRVLQLDVQTLADGHVGLLTRPRPALAALLEVPLEPPTRRFAVASAPDTQTVEGRYVQWPVADAWGRRPARLRADDGTWWGLAASPVEGHEGWHQRRVRVVGRPRVDASAGGLGGPQLAVEGIEALDTAPPGVRRVPIGDLEGLEGAWVEVVVVLDGLRPLDVGSAFVTGEVEGRRVTAPATGRDLEGFPVTLLAQVGPGTLHAAAVCAGDTPGCGLSATATGTPGAPDLRPVPGTPPAAGRR